MVPILFYIFSFAGIEQAFIMHLALGTSFSIIIPTSIILRTNYNKLLLILTNSYKLLQTLTNSIILGTKLLQTLSYYGQNYYKFYPLMDKTITNSFINETNSNKLLQTLTYFFSLVSESDLRQKTVLFFPVKLNTLSISA